MRQIVALCVLVGAALLLGSGIVQAQCNGCAGDRNGDEQVTIDELVKAVNRALTGCGDNVACMSDSDCDPDEICADGTCIGRPDPCSSDSDCDPDETCVGGNCR